MHKGIMLLVKTTVRQEVIRKVEEFLGEYKGDVWDWHKIGGRWSGTLNKHHDAFFKWVDKTWPIEKEAYGRSYNWIEQHLSEFQRFWESLGEKSKNPYSRDTFISRDYDTIYKDDVMSLCDCLEKVKEWQQDPVKDGMKEIKEAERWLAPRNTKGNDYNMYGYCLKAAAEILQQHFSFEANVFNIEEYDFSIPKDCQGWFVVMIDIHN